MKNALAKLKKGGGTLAVVGSGRMGCGIALTLFLHLGGLAKNSSLKLVVLDENDTAREKARAAFLKAIPEDSTAWSRITFTENFEDLTEASLVIEAVIEDLEVKKNVLGRIESVVGRNSVIVSNSSNIRPEQMTAILAYPERFCNVHFFNPVPKNPAVEVVLGEKSDTALADELMALLHGAQFFPIQVASSPAFALNPVIESLAVWLMKLISRGLITPDQADVVSMKVLGTPLMAVMDMIGGNPIMPVACELLGNSFLPWMKEVPEALLERIESGTPWRSIKELSELPAMEPSTAEFVQQTLEAVYLSVVGYLVEHKIVDREDLEHGIAIAFRMTPPSKLVKSIGGPVDAYSIVASASESVPGIYIPQKQTFEALAKPAALVHMRLVGATAVISIRNSLKMNSLSQAIIKQLDAALDHCERAEAVKSVVITGSAGFFSAGADIKGILSARGDEEAVRKLINEGKRVFRRIENFGKPVVAAMQGPAFGGGLELALHCHVRIASGGILVGLPEITLGIVPGWGGMVKVPQLCADTAEAVHLIRSGKPISAKKALELGLLDELVSPASILETAISHAEEMAQWTELPMRESKAKWFELKHSSLNPAPEADRFVCDFLESLMANPGDVDGSYERETDAFVLAFNTDDATIGLTHFASKGQGPAPFTGKTVVTV
jgi:enoyl-CoA hydratase